MQHIKEVLQKKRTILNDKLPIDHIHEWFTPNHVPNEEKIQWCRNCFATKDSDGGIIE